MNYIYFSRGPNQADAAMPDGCTEVKPWKEPGYEQSVRCDIYGYVRFCRPLSTEEVAKHRLIPDPRNLLAGVMRG